MPFWRNRRLLDIAIVLISIAYPFLVYFGLMRFSPLSVALALVEFPLLQLGVLDEKPLHGGKRHV